MVFRLLFGKQKENPDSRCSIPEVKPSERVYAVGDIHGRDDLLNDMIKVIARDIVQHDDDRTPKIVFLGDYVDRGDHSRQVVDILMSIESDLEVGSVTFLRGNHEAAVLGFLEDPSRHASWLRFGGLQTMASYGVSPPMTTSESGLLHRAQAELAAAMGPHVAFLQATVPLYQSGDVVFVHAGLDPTCALEDQTEDAMLWGRSDFIEVGGIEGLRVVHGHYDAPEPVITPRRVCLDTGAYYSGTLTCMRFDDGSEILTSRGATLGRAETPFA